MKEKIIAFLRTKMNGAPEAYLLGVAEHYSKTVTDETQIATTLTDGVVDLLKVNAGLLQTEGDRRATEAAKTAIKTFREKHGLNEDGTPLKKDPDPPKKGTNDPDEPAWFKAYRETKDAELAALNEKLEKQEKEKAKTALVDKVKSHDKLKNIDPLFLKGRNLIPESEDKIEQLVTELETDWNTFAQAQAERGVHIIAPAASAGAEKEGAAIAAKIAEKRNTNSSEGVKGKAI